MRAFSVVLGASVTLGGCGWWYGDEGCDVGAQRCVGDELQTCQPDPAKGESRWYAVLSCAEFSDELGGAYTCGEEHGQPSCVPASEGDEAGVGEESDEPERQSHWAAIALSQPSKGAEHRLELLRTAELFPSEAPVGAAAGEVALVAYEGKRPLDAVLVRTTSDSARSEPEPLSTPTAWLRIEGADRIALVRPDGSEEASLSLEEAENKGRGAVERQLQALTAPLPPTLRVHAPIDGPAPSEVSLAMGPLVEPTAEVLDLLSKVFARTPAMLAGSVTAIGFAATPDPAASAEEGPAEMVELEPSPRAEDGPEAMLVGSHLYIDVSPSRLEHYRRFDDDLVLAVVHQLALAYASTSRGPTKQTFGPSDFPVELQALIRKRMSPILLPNEGLREVWAALQQTGVEAAIAGPYRGLGYAEVSDEEAAREGFFSALGSQDADQDFAQTVALLHVPGESWRTPCRSFAGPVSELDVRAIVPLAKVEVARRIGVVSEEHYRRCVLLDWFGDGFEGVELHTPQGSRIVFDEDPIAIRQSLVRGQTSLSMMATRGGVAEGTTAVLNVATSGALKGVRRLVATDQRPEAEEGAGFYLSNPMAAEATATDSIGGLLFVDEVRSDGVTAWGLLLKQRGPMFGASIYPLVRARAAELLMTEGGEL